MDHDDRRGLFAYGTLEIPEVILAVAGRVPASQPVVLAGYRRGLLEGESYPAIAECEGHSTPGTLYMGMDEPEWQALDAFENDEYERRRVAVTGASGERTLALAYVIPTAHASKVTAAAWDRDVFERLHMQTLLTWWGQR